jgi:hypothetical protein
MANRKNGKGAVYHRADGRWEAQFRLPGIGRWGGKSQRAPPQSPAVRHAYSTRCVRQAGQTR